MPGAHVPGCCGRSAAEAGQRAIPPALGKAGFQTGRKQAGRGDRAQTTKPCGCDLPASLPARAPASRRWTLPVTH